LRDNTANPHAFSGQIRVFNFFGIFQGKPAIIFGMPRYQKIFGEFFKPSSKTLIGVARR